MVGLPSKTNMNIEVETDLAELTSLTDAFASQQRDETEAATEDESTDPEELDTFVPPQRTQEEADAELEGEPEDEVEEEDEEEGEEGEASEEEESSEESSDPAPSELKLAIEPLKVEEADPTHSSSELTSDQLVERYKAHVDQLAAQYSISKEDLEVINGADSALEGLLSVLPKMAARIHIAAASQAAAVIQANLRKSIEQELSSTRTQQTFDDQLFEAFPRLRDVVSAHPGEATRIRQARAFIDQQAPGIQVSEVVARVGSVLTSLYGVDLTQQVESKEEDSQSTSPTIRKKAAKKAFTPSGRKGGRGGAGEKKASGNVFEELAKDLQPFRAA